MKTRRPWLAIVAGAALLFSLPLAAKEAVTLGIADDTAKEIAPVLEHLNTSPSIEVQLKVFPNHDELYDALRQKKIDLAFLGAVKYVEAHFDFGATPIVSEGPTVLSYIVVPPNSPIKSVAELKGKRFAFGYEDSTTTHLIPALVLSKHGIKEKDIKPSYVGHVPQKLIDDMLAGKFDAAAASDLTYGQNKSRVRSLDVSDPFPGPPIVARAGLAEGTMNEVRRMFVSYKAAENAKGARFSKGATVVTDADYNRIRFLCKVLFNKMYQ